MRITADISLYPLREDFVPDILAFIAVLREAPGIEVVTNQMSTQVRGEFDAVHAAIGTAMRQVFGDGGSRAVVVKYLNADLDIQRAPRLDGDA